MGIEAFKKGLYYEDENGFYEDYKYLTEKYVPEEILHRDDEIDKIYKKLGKYINPLRNFKNWNLVIHGKTGIGKTHAVKRVKKGISEEMGNGNIDYEFIYVNCADKTVYQIFIKIIRSIDQSYPHTGWGLDRVINDLKSILIDLDKLILVLDEVDKLSVRKGKNLDTLIYRYKREALPNNLRGEDVFITITNDNSIYNKLKKHNKDVYRANDLLFRDYAAPEIIDILSKRCDKAFKDGVIDDESIKLAGCISKRKGGASIRYAINLVKQAAAIIEDADRCTISTEDVKRAESRLENNMIKEDILNMDIHSMISLVSLLLQGGCSGDTKSMYENYCMIANENGIDPNSFSSFRQTILGELDERGLIMIENNGNKGKNNVYHIGDDCIKDIIIRIFDNEQDFGDEIYIDLDNNNLEKIRKVNYE